MTRPSLIPGGVTVEGELSGKGDLVILGRVLGDIRVDGLLIIEEGGAVRGEVRASSVVVRGALAGNAVGQESVRVEGSAQVIGDLRAPRVKVADGARVKGRVQIGAEAGITSPRVAAQAVSPLAASPAAAPTRLLGAATDPAAAVAAADSVAAAVVGPRVRRARTVAPLEVARPEGHAASRPAFVRPPLTMPRLTRVAAERR
ncbi:MAG: polymer-forming cytoskeletal protein [Polyangiales bacterium]|nr:polymer-forming cytoskeletal protein [Myxococcales bacterium]MCB9661416.1 polymer-forming cytoskeletal protein [Sandaracinaceae bacterium]